MRSQAARFTLFLSFFLAFADYAEAETYLEMGKNDLISVFKPENRLLTLMGIGTTTAFAVFEGQISDQVQHETVEHKPLGKYSAIGDYSGQMISNVLYVVGMTSYGLIAEDARSLRRAGVMFRASAASAFVSTLLKTAIREPRPNDPKQKDSFPSGHATTAFAFASVVGAEHGIWYGGAAYATALLVAYSRINDNRHYLHDVIGGAAIGLSYGISVSRRSHREKIDETEVSKIAVFPTSDLAGLSAKYSTTF